MWEADRVIAEKKNRREQNNTRKNITTVMHYVVTRFQ